jgi:hypothetical protein
MAETLGSVTRAWSWGNRTQPACAADTPRPTALNILYYYLPMPSIWRSLISVLCLPDSSSLGSASFQILNFDNMRDLGMAAHPHGDCGGAGLHHQAYIHQGGAGAFRPFQSQATPPSFMYWGWPTGWATSLPQRNDPVGLQPEEENLPKRIRGTRKQKLTKDK